MELGWHPNLTLDPPLMPPSRVPTLVGPDGCLWPLGTFMRRLFLGLVSSAEIALELRAQFDRFVKLVGHPPSVVNSHQHVQLFHPVGPILLALLARHGCPYVRRVQEPWSMLVRIPGARLKRSFLTVLGRCQVQQQIRMGFPGNDWLAGITNPPWVADPGFLVRWLTRIPGECVELACHPGYLDPTLVGRDCTTEDGWLTRRVDELHLLLAPSFRQACQRAGFTLLAPSELTKLPPRQSRVA
jgi:predicted glycoside hydrolase/deacetylase ChbG (UPF0249 family)